MKFGPNNREDSLRFVVEPRDIHLKGVRLFASVKEDKEFRAVLRLLNNNGDLLATKEGTFKNDHCSDAIFVVHSQEPRTEYYGFDVMFEVPVLIRKTSKYKIEVELQGPQFIETNRLRVVNKDGIYFNFDGTSRRISELLFLN